MAMKALVIHAPDSKVKLGAPSFATILAQGMGPGYAIPKSWIPQLPTGSKVVVLRNNKVGPLSKRERAEGVLVKLGKTTIPPTKTPQGIQRYDVYFKDYRTVTYKPENLERWGTALI
jgi:hypothetical protein